MWLAVDMLIFGAIALLKSRHRPPTTDKPRIVIVCHPSQCREVQASVMKLGYDDVLVQRNKYVDPGRAYAMKPLTEIAPFRWDDR